MTHPDSSLPTVSAGPAPATPTTPAPATPTTPAPATPATPTGLRATAVGPGTVDLSLAAEPGPPWCSALPDLPRRPAGGRYPPKPGSDHRCSPGSHGFTVRAYDAVGNLSPPSNRAAITLR